MAADNKSAEIEKGLDDPGMSGDGQFKKNIISKEGPVDVRVVYDTPQVKGVERRRLLNEDTLLWNVYFDRKKTTDERDKRDRAGEIKDANKKDLKGRLQEKQEADKRAKEAKKADKKGVKKVELTAKKVEIKDTGKGSGKKIGKKGGKGIEKKLTVLIGVQEEVVGAVYALQSAGNKNAREINRNKTSAEASIFWHVYYKIKARKEKKKDTKGKTKITPVGAAVEKIKGVKKPKKEGKGFISWLLSLFAPFAKLLGPLLGGGGLFAGLAGVFTTLMGAIGPLIIAGAGIFALVAAIAFAANAIGKAWRGWKDMKQAQKEAEHAEKHGKEQALIVQDIYNERMEKAKAAGLDDEYRIAELQGLTLARGDEATRRMSQHEGMFKRTEHRKRKEQEKMDAEGWDEKGQEIHKELRALLDKQLIREARGEKVRRMEDEVTFDKFYVNVHEQYGVGVHSEDVQARAHAEAERETMGKEAVPTKYNPGKKKLTAAEVLAQRKAKRRAKMTPEQIAVFDAQQPLKSDFVSRPGMAPIAFESVDDILGFKQGGPVSDLLKFQASPKGGQASPIGGSVNFGKFQLDAIGLSNAYLKQLVELTVKLLQKGSSGGGGGKGFIPAAPLPQSNSIQGDMSGPTYTDSRSDFYGSAYNMHTPSVQA